MAAGAASGVGVHDGLRITRSGGETFVQDGLPGGAFANAVDNACANGAGAAGSVRLSSLSGGAESADAVFQALSVRALAESVDDGLPERTTVEANPPPRPIGRGAALAAFGADVIRHLMEDVDILLCRARIFVFHHCQQVQRAVAACVLFIPVKTHVSEGGLANIQPAAEIIQHARPQRAGPRRRVGKGRCRVVDDIPAAGGGINRVLIGSGGQKHADNFRVSVARGDNQQRSVSGVFPVGVASRPGEQIDDDGEVGGSRRLFHLLQQGGGGGGEGDADMAGLVGGKRPGGAAVGR